MTGKSYAKSRVQLNLNDRNRHLLGPLSRGGAKTASDIRLLDYLKGVIDLDP